MEHPVSIWSNTKDGEYQDRVVFESPSTLIMRYFGQRTGKMDHILGPNAYFFHKDGKKDPYKYIGKVLACTYLETVDTVRVYELAIHKEPPIEFPRKNDACAYFGWEHLNQFAVLSGIIQHKCGTAA
jgi:hypothetical protein